MNKQIEFATSIEDFPLLERPLSSYGQFEKFIVSQSFMILCNDAIEEINVR